MHLYLDTSVFGAMFDTEPSDRKEKTKMFFRGAEKRQDILYISDVVLDEIARAPEHLRASLEEVVSKVRPLVLPEPPEALMLAEA